MTRLFQPTIHLAKDAPETSLLGKRLSVRVGEDSAPHYLRRYPFESTVFERAHCISDIPTAFSLIATTECQWEIPTCAILVF